MSSRPLIKPHAVIENGDMSSSITSDVTIIQNVSMLSFDISWVGSSPVGSMSVEVSNSYSQNADGSVKNVGSWTALTLSTAADVSGNTGNGFIDLEQLAAYAVRIKYVRTSGTGTINVTVNGKVQ
jgi:hypothetical protein